MTTINFQHERSDSLESLIGSFTTQNSLSSIDLSDPSLLLIGTKARSKLKKDALEFVDYIKEYQSDHKYKTELCKSYSETGFCAYGNKCRFAHGRQELFDKVIACKKYKQKECNSFFKNMYCCYGSRCHFRHEQRKLEDVERSFYTLCNMLLNTHSEEQIEKNKNEQLITLNCTKRLAVFSNLTERKRNLLFNVHLKSKGVQQCYWEPVDTLSHKKKFSLNCDN
jgi:hypothetical protein